MGGVIISAARIVSSSPGKKYCWASFYQGENEFRKIYQNFF